MSFQVEQNHNGWAVFWAVQGYFLSQFEVKSQKVEKVEKNKLIMMVYKHSI